MATLNPAKSNGYYSNYDNQFHIYKNGLYKNEKAIDNAIHYVTRTGNRADRGKDLISWGAAGICFLATPDDCIVQFKAVQRIVRRDKEVGTQIVHEILTFTDYEEAFFVNNTEALCRLAQYCANIYFEKGFQCVYGIHYGIHCNENDDSSLKKKRLHIHFIVNAVNYITGNKFATKLSSKAFTLNGKTFFKIPYDTKEREQEINHFMYSQILCMDNPYDTDKNNYLVNAYPLYPLSG